MKPPPPRTLAGTPAPQLRLPRAATADARFPPLALVLAGGAALPACASPVCGDTRGDELEAHGATSVQAARRGEGAEALREIGVALGLVAHPSATRPDTMTPAGAPPPVELTPPVVQPPPPPPIDPSRIRPSGGPVAVRPRPPVQVPAPTLRDPMHPMRPRPPQVTAGTPMPVSPRPQTVAPPTPVPPTVNPAPRPPTASPSPDRGARRGDMLVVGPHAPRTRT